MTNMLTGKVAVVTGGGQSLGLAIATAFAAEGCNVLLVGRNPLTLQHALPQFAGLPGRAAVLRCDVTDLDASERIGAATDQHFGRWDALVNCAGTFVWKSLLDLSLEDWQSSLDTNLSAPFRLSQGLVRRLMATQQAGSIINIGSIHGLVGDANAVPQCASKFGLLGLTKALAEACREHNIRVNAINPGAIESDSPHRLSLTTDGRVTQADVAQLAVYLTSDQASFVTGAIVDAFGLTRPVIANA